VAAPPVPAPFPVAAAAASWWPLLEDPRILDSHFMIEDIRLSRLKRLAMLGAGRSEAATRA